MASNITPRTSMSDCYEFADKLCDLEVGLINGDLSPMEFSRGKEDLHTAYNGKIFSQDEHLFSDEQSYVQFLRKNGVSETKLTDIIEHERAHFDKAKELGLEAHYGVWVCADGCAPFVLQSGRTATPEENRQIATAPKSPGWLDRF